MINVARLSLNAVYKSFIYEEMVVPVLRAITVSFIQGTTYTITGASGTGKSTLMHILAGLETPSQGCVYINDMVMSKLTAHDHQHFLINSIGLLFQRPYLIAELSVVENSMISGLIAGKDKRWCFEEAARLLRMLGLEHKIHSKPNSLSGGQQQRVALARALFNKPQFLLADEPTGNLDGKTGKEIVDLLLACRDQWGMGIVVSTHDRYLASAMDTEYELKDGGLWLVREPVGVMGVSGEKAREFGG